MQAGNIEYEPLGPSTISAWVKQVQEHGLTGTPIITYFGVVSVNLTSVDIHMLLRGSIRKAINSRKIREKAAQWDE